MQNSNRNRVRQLTVAGVAQHGSVYPNAERTLAILRSTGACAVVDHAHWLPPNTQLWQVAQGSSSARVRMLARLFWHSFVQALRVLLGTRRGTPVYVPYPSLFLLCWLACVPRRLRPHLIADVYISIWDSMFRDRSTRLEDSRVSRVLRWAEGRALRTADLVLTDTEANVEQLSTDFALPAGRVTSLPLAIDEARFLAIEPKAAPPSARVRILFIGTMIPLHGIDVVLDAIRSLRDDDRVEFRLIGDGQLSARVGAALAQCDPQRVTWLRGLYGLDVLAEEIAAADICLGVFGGSGKSARVLPFKLYLYFASGRAVISQAALSTPAGALYPPIERVDFSDAETLASVILKLVDNPARRIELAAASREYYERWLSNAQLGKAWTKLLSDADAHTNES